MREETSPVSSPTRRGSRSRKPATQRNPVRELKKFLRGYTKLVIIGVGNPLRGDDGIGPYLIEQLKERLPQREDIVLIDAQTVLENFIGKVVSAKPSHLLIIDAVLDEDKQPGEWMLLEPGQMESGFHSTHSMPVSLFCQAVKKETGCSIMGIGIVPEQTFSPQELSPEISIVCQEISDFIGSITHD